MPHWLMGLSVKRRISSFQLKNAPLKRTAQIIWNDALMVSGKKPLSVEKQDPLAAFLTNAAVAPSPPHPPSVPPVSSPPAAAGGRADDLWLKTSRVINSALLAGVRVRGSRSTSKLERSEATHSK